MHCHGNRKPKQNLRPFLFLGIPVLDFTSKGGEQIFSESEDKKSQFWSREKPMAIPSLQAKEGSALEKCLEVSWLEPNKTGALPLANPKYTILFYITRWLPFTPKQSSELLYSDPSVD